MMPADAKPSKKVEELVINAVAVKLFFTFWNKSSTPFSKTLSYCFSALNPLITRIQFIVSVRRPVTSAFILPRALKIGRIYPNAFKAIRAKIITGTKTNKVICALISINIIKEIMAVIVPPMSCTNPVPTKFLTPSTSVITLETKAPDLLLSKKLTGRVNNFFCTLARRIEIKCCASTLKIRVKEKELID